MDKRRIYLWEVTICGVILYAIGLFFILTGLTEKDVVPLVLLMVGIMLTTAGIIKSENLTSEYDPQAEILKLKRLAVLVADFEDSIKLLKASLVVEDPETITISRHIRSLMGILDTMDDLLGPGWEIENKLQIDPIMKKIQKIMESQKAQAETMIPPDAIKKELDKQEDTQ